MKKEITITEVVGLYLLVWVGISAGGELIGHIINTAKKIKESRES